MEWNKFQLLQKDKRQRGIGGQNVITIQKLIKLGAKHEKKREKSEASEKEYNI